MLPGPEEGPDSLNLTVGWKRKHLLNKHLSRRYLRPINTRLFRLGTPGPRWNTGALGSPLQISWELFKQLEDLHRDLPTVRGVSGLNSTTGDPKESVRLSSGSPG